MTRTDRATALQQLKQERFDVLIVGGGITGAWIALRCATLGLKTAVIERGDFAGETSSSSSKLLHGGIRYLQQMQFGKVRESALERAAYLASAPHLADAVPFLVPTYKDFKRSKLFLACGMLAYQTLGLGQKKIIGRDNKIFPRTAAISAQQLNEICDLTHDDHTGAISFPEFHMHDTERTVWSVLDSARRSGAVVANYVNADDFIVTQTPAGIQTPAHSNASGKTARRIDGVVATDRAARKNAAAGSFAIKTKLVVNAAGPWVDGLNRGLNTQPAALINGYAVGAHLITRQIIADAAIAITTKHKSGAKIDRGGRHVFVIPWRNCSLIGTSYRETSDPDAAAVLDSDDVAQLIEAINHAIPKANLAADDILGAYSGLYPLRVDTVESKVYQGSGEYVILDHQRTDAVEGLVTALGAKFTTARILAAKTMGLIEHKLEIVSPGDVRTGSRTEAVTGVAPAPDAEIKLACSAYANLDVFRARQYSRLDERFSADQIEHLIKTYGSDLDAFIAFLDAQDDASLEQPMMATQADILGQVAWAIDHEMALRLDDVLLRRTSTGLLGISDAEIRQVARLMAQRLGWSETETAAEIDKTRQRKAVISNAINVYFAQLATAS